MADDAPVPVTPAAGDPAPAPTSSPPAIPTARKAKPGSSDRQFLDGPHSRWREIQLLFRATRDFIKGFRVLHFAGPCVTIFGSARFGEAHPYYPIARELGRRVSLMGFTVMTGGGPGLMEAANRGARDAGGTSVGCNIELPHEQDVNAYVDRHVTCHYFFVRKVLLFKYSYAFIALPGGLGTLDELTEALTLIQTRKIQNYPVVLIGVEYWAPFIALLEEMVRDGAVSPGDLDLVKVTDDLDEALTHLETNTIGSFGLSREKRKPSWWLGEH
ncbi:MAG TPA: TIGR00730 family Rossman fold protein [Vicinamibacterales bacterium]|nr:TIGR00730 family Rossman fold protein [Vicinamibacterales bacterium]